MNASGLDPAMESRVARAAASVVRDVGSLGEGPPLKGFPLSQVEPVSPEQRPAKKGDQLTKCGQAVAP